MTDANLKWGDKDKMICQTCKHSKVRQPITADGVGLPEYYCDKGSGRFNPLVKNGGRGCPEWEPAIVVPDNQEVQ